MRTFVEYFWAEESKDTYELVRQINNYAEDNNLEIVSISTIVYGDIPEVLVVFRRGDENA